MELNQRIKVPNYVNFVFASLAGVGGTIACYPLELLKTKMQISHKRASIIDPIRFTIKHHGITGFYKGLTASILRQALNTGVRLGTYQSGINHFSENEKAPSIYITIGIGIISGALGALISLPADVALTRMAEESLLPKYQQQYKSVFKTIKKINKDEGHRSLTRGAAATVLRTIIMNISQLVTYSHAKEALVEMGIAKPRSTACHVLSSICSAIVTTFCILPPDVAKVRLQKGTALYTGTIDVWKKVIKSEGVTTLWKGYTPIMLRNGPQNVVFFLIYEKLMYLYEEIVTGSPNKK